jgi:hypothetical protein
MHHKYRLWSLVCSDRRTENSLVHQQYHSSFSMMAVSGKKGSFQEPKVLVFGLNLLAHGTLLYDKMKVINH